MKSLLILLSIPLIVQATISCHYCGVRKLCPLPYRDIEAETVSCAKSCMKFDGYSETDNKRVLIRSCGEEDVNRCSKNSTWFGARGEMCLCNAANCNSAPQNVSHHTVFTILSCILMLFAIKYY